MTPFFMQPSRFHRLLFACRITGAIVSIFGLTMALAQPPSTTPQPLPTLSPSPPATASLVPPTSSPLPELIVPSESAIAVGETRMPDEWSWTSFWENALGGLFSSAFFAVVVSVVVYRAITRPRERKAAEERKLQLLGMLKSEMETNLERVKKCIELLEPIEDVDSKSLPEKIMMWKFSDVTQEQARALGAAMPRKYTRGVWNALKEDGFITQLDDPQLVFYLLRTNEAMVVADSSRRTLRTALLKGETDIDAPAHVALVDGKNLLTGLEKVLTLLNQMNLPPFRSGEIPVNEGD